MSRTRKFLAFDLGASSGRAMLGLFDGKKLRLKETHRFPNGPTIVNGTLYWDALRLFEEIKTGLALSIGKSSGPIAGVGVDTWGVDFALIAKSGEMLSNPVAYRDSRTDGIMPKAFRKVSKKEIFERTGIQFLQFNTLFQLFAMARSRSTLLEASDTLLMMPDLFNYFLTGERVCEFTNATTSQAFDPHSMKWSKPLLKKLGIPVRIFGPVVRPGTVIGSMLRDVAREVGAKNITVIAPGSHDTASAVAAVPAAGQRWAYLSSGTWSLLGAEMKKPIINAKALAMNFTNEGGVEGTFRLLKNLAGLWMLEECRRAWRKRDGKLLKYDRMASMAGTARPFPFVLDADDEAFLRPDNMPEAVRAYCRRTSQNPPRSRAEIVRGIMESLALKYRLVTERLEELLGYKIDVLHVVGGGSKNGPLCQWTADSLGIPVVAGPVEATATGNILMQMMAMKEITSLDQAREIVRISFPMKIFRPGSGDRWEEAVEHYRNLAF